MNDITKQILDRLDRWQTAQRVAGKEPSFDDINAFLQQQTTAHNQMPQRNFCGLSPLEISAMINRPFEIDCPVTFRSFTDEEALQAPIMQQVMVLLKHLSEKEIKLTKTGALPLKVVREVYDAGMPECWVEANPTNSLREQNTESVQLVRIALEETSVTKVRTGKLSLTAKGKKLVEKPSELFKDILTYLLTRFNKGYFDNYESMEIGNVGTLYALFTLHKFGGDWKQAAHYAKLYYRAFEQISPEYQAYESRLFFRLFYHIGLCELKVPKHYDFGMMLVRETPLLYKTFSFRASKGAW